MSYFYHLRISGTAYKERIFINIKQYKVTIVIAKMVDKIKVTGSGYLTTPFYVKKSRLVALKINAMIKDKCLNARWTTRIHNKVSVEDCRLAVERSCFK